MPVAKNLKLPANFVLRLKAYQTVTPTSIIAQINLLATQAKCSKITSMSQVITLWHALSQHEAQQLPQLIEQWLQLRQASHQVTDGATQAAQYLVALSSLPTSTQEALRSMVTKLSLTDPDQVAEATLR